MNCDNYRQHELGELDEVGFQRHASTCPTCKERVSQDARRMALAGDLEPPDPAPFLWDRSEATMVAEQGRRNRRRTWVYRVAAVLVVVSGWALSCTSVPWARRTHRPTSTPRPPSRRFATGN